ncbi:PfkB family carbohydrate kinase [Glycomyces sp. TRM65418]|uniref:PfkB family carbohydrate kinase n=1 Tax=Glycomyces sp. TRM65418 TaxID=2867006 RepID=UPI001CE65954|nr:PfkB family carbohydrate kinase [Glycomyces sp. TRM65418]MCC3761860.1 PfkB family carbohydrate kinase [Glycomyces sp. TRM65418]QZD55941.1 adenylyltransferase/cytidyltransferase family protein [Glycomyces sp. TRM65418]
MTHRSPNGRKRLVVVGDAFLDVDLDGRSERLCPEAPVPVVDAQSEVRRPGGAGLAAVLAAADCQGLTAPAVGLVTAIGDDPAGRQLRELLAPQVDLAAVPLCGTTVRKIRIRASGQLVTRVDDGDGRAPDGGLVPEAFTALQCADAVLVADYGRGLAAHPGLRRLLAQRALDIPIVWDPHPKGPPPVRGTALVTPNLAEARRLAPGDHDVAELAAALRAAFACEAVAVTEGERGATIATAHRVERISPPAAASSAHWTDTCGAGDRFSAAAATALLRGLDLTHAVASAVAAASEFVAAGGAGAVGERSHDDAASQVNVGSAASRGDADTVRTGEAAAPPATSEPADAFALAERIRGGGGTLVATGGCFDLLHPGHVSLLRRARAMGDALVVCLNSDRSIQELKGPGRPILPAAARAEMLMALTAVDAVAVFDEPTPDRVLDRLRPDVWVKGGDYDGLPLPEAHTVRRHGGEIVTVPTVDGYSTTGLVNALNINAAGADGNGGALNGRALNGRPMATGDLNTNDLDTSDMNDDPAVHGDTVNSRI